LLFESECLQLLLYEFVNPLLDLLEVLVVIFVYCCNLSEDALFLLRAAQLGEPFGLCCLFAALLL
jgi:hypothetical protein